MILQPINFLTVMKKSYIQPLANTSDVCFTSGLMVVIGSEEVEDGFAKERGEVVEEDFDPTMIEQKDDWKVGLW